MFGKKLSAAGMLCLLIYFDLDPLMNKVGPSQWICPGWLGGSIRKGTKSQGVRELRWKRRETTKGTNLEREIPDRRNRVLEVLKG